MAKKFSTLLRQKSRLPSLQSFTEDEVRKIPEERFREQDLVSNRFSNAFMYV